MSSRMWGCCSWCNKLNTIWCQLTNLSDLIYYIFWKTWLDDDMTWPFLMIFLFEWHFNKKRMIQIDWIKKNNKQRSKIRLTAQDSKHISSFIIDLHWSELHVLWHPPCCSSDKDGENSFRFHQPEPQSLHLRCLVKLDLQFSNTEGPSVRAGYLSMAH